MAEDLKVGEIVHLNSGSPDMTVTEVTEYVVRVMWVDSIGESKTLLCPPDCFERCGLSARTE